MRATPHGFKLQKLMGSNKLALSLHKEGGTSFRDKPFFLFQLHGKYPGALLAYLHVIRWWTYDTDIPPEKGKL